MSMKKPIQQIALSAGIDRKATALPAAFRFVPRPQENERAEAAGEQGEAGVDPRQQGKRGAMQPPTAQARSVPERASSSARSSAQIPVSTITPPTPSGYTVKL